MALLQDTNVSEDQAASLFRVKILRYVGILPQHHWTSQLSKTSTWIFTVVKTSKLAAATAAFRHYKHNPVTIAKEK
jgi:hypothetical protein